MEIEQGNFLTTLAQLLNVPANIKQRYHPSVTFRYDVGAVIIRDRQHFCGKVMPRYFRHRNFQLFRHQVPTQLIQVESAGIRFVEGDHTDLPQLCSAGAIALKQRMKYLRQSALVSRMGTSFCKELARLEQDLADLPIDKLIDRIFELKKFNSNYTSRLECYSRGLEAKRNRLVGNLPLLDGSEMCLPEGTDFPECVRTEKLIRFAS